MTQEFDPASTEEVQLRVSKEVAELHRRIGDAGIAALIAAHIETLRQVPPDFRDEWPAFVRKLYLHARQSVAFGDTPSHVLEAARDILVTALLPVTPTAGASTRAENWIRLTHHQAQAVADRAERLRRLAKHRGTGLTGRERVELFIGNPYYSEPNPELHGLYLKIEGASAPVPLFAKDLGHERNFEVARLGMRDTDGHVQHPDMEGIGWDEFDMGPQLRALGWITQTVSFESDASDEAQARYSDANDPDCSYWTPSRPEGEGWLLAAIYDTEDGPVALFVREAKDKELEK